MSSCKNYIILFALLCLSFEASSQYDRYAKLIRGEKSPLDTAVAIQIAEYRAIRFKVSIADSLIRSMRDEIEQLNLLSREKDTVNIIQSKMLVLDQAIIDEHSKTISDLSKSIDVFAKNADTKSPWYTDWKIVLPGGAFIGALIDGFLHRK